jgi:hypothetical protein
MKRKGREEDNRNKRGREDNMSRAWDKEEKENTKRRRREHEERR